MGDKVKGRLMPAARVCVRSRVRPRSRAGQGRGPAWWGDRVSGPGSRPGAGCAHVLQEAGAQLAQVGALPVEPLLQRLHKRLLAPVDVLDVPKDGAQLLFAEHVGALATLPDVALRPAARQVSLRTPPLHPPHPRQAHLADVAQVLNVVPLGAEDLVDDVGPHLVFAALRLGPSILGPAVPRPQSFLVGGLVLVHPQLQAARGWSAPLRSAPAEGQRPATGTRRQRGTEARRMCRHGSPFPPTRETTPAPLKVPTPPSLPSPLLVLDSVLGAEQTLLLLGSRTSACLRRACPRGL